MRTSHDFNFDHKSLRLGYAFLYISLPRFVVSNSSFGLLARQIHFLGYVIDARRSILFLIVPITRRSKVKLVCGRPFCFYVVSGLNATSFWHACGLPSGVCFLTGDSTRRIFELRIEIALSCLELRQIFNSASASASRTRCLRRSQLPEVHRPGRPARRS